MERESTYVVRRGDRLLCGFPGCRGQVGELRWDEYGWLRPVVRLHTCPSCGRHQLLNLELLEAATQALYMTA